MRIFYSSFAVYIVAYAGIQAVGYLAFLLGEVQPPDGLLTFISQLGAVGVLAWYCWYTNTHTLPKFFEQFESLLRDIQDKHDRQVMALIEKLEVAYKHDHDLRVGKQD